MIYLDFNPEIVRKPSAQEFIRHLFKNRDKAISERVNGVSYGRGTTYFLKTHDLFSCDSVLRHYYRGGLFGKLVKDRYFFSNLEKTRAVQEFSLLLQLHQLGLPVPRPIAYHIKRCGCVYQADILLEKITESQDLSKLLQSAPLNEAEYREIGSLIRRLHQHQVFHSDLNIHNIMRDSQGKFWLIDFDKCAITDGEDWKAANLARLKRSFLKEKDRLQIHFNDDDWLALLTGYHT